jgi:hypothetical protein
MQRQAERQALEADRATDRKLDRAGAKVRTLATAVLLASGYHTHKGQWRKKRVVKDIQLTLTEKDRPRQFDGSLGDFVDLLNRVNSDKPSSKDIARLRETLSEIPELSKPLGDLNKIIRLNLIDGLMADGQATKMSIKTLLELKQEELGYEAAPPLEKLLIENILNSWLRLMHVEFNMTQRQARDTSVVVLEHWDKRLSAAQRRFLRACSTLASIRKMNLPPIQVNIAQQQVNQVNTAV